VYKENSPIILTWTAKADGKNGVTTSTKIDFTFSGAVAELTANDIIISTITGTVTKGALTGNGTAWSLEITVEEPGAIMVSVGKTSVDSESQNIAVHKAGLKGESSNDDEDDPDYDESQDGPLGVKLNSIVLSGDGLSNGKLSLPIEGYVTLTATIDPAGTGAPVQWQSNKSSVATVTDNHDGTATVTATGGGSAVIKAATWGKSTECTVTVAYGTGLYRAGGAVLVEDTSFEEGFTLAKAFAWIKNSGQNDEEYLIVLGANENVDTTYSIGTGNSSSQTGTGNWTNVKITLREAAEDIVVKKTNTGALFQIYGNSASDKPELVLEDITLEGNSGTAAVVVVGNANNSKMGTLTMKAGSRITGNTNNSYGGGIMVKAGGTFNMEGGQIDGNTAASGGGVAGDANSTFIMTGGTIKSNFAVGSATNTAGQGGGVYGIAKFTMSGGFIEENRAENRGTGVGIGGGVHLPSDNFTMSGNAVIRGNNAARGGGIYIVAAAKVVIQGGSIEGNTATKNGAAVCIIGTTTATFSKTGGVIYGVNAVEGKANKAAAGVESTVHSIEKGAISSGNLNLAHYYDDDLNGNLSTADLITGWSTP
jgi:hypothetical protein